MALDPASAGVATAGESRPDRHRRPHRHDGVRGATRRPLLRRLARDPYLLLTAGLAVSVLALGPLSGDLMLAEVVVITAGFLAAQALLGLAAPSSRRWRTAWSTVRFLAALGLVALVVLLTGEHDSPLDPLYVPVVVLAAAFGTVQAVVVGVVVVITHVIPETLQHGAVDEHVIRSATIAGAAVILAIGARWIVGARERALGQLRAALAAERRQARQIAGVEAVGRIVASAGPTPEVLDRVMAVLTDRFGYRYRYCSIYVSDGAAFRLGAQRGYADPVPVFDWTAGVVGRVIRTRRVELIPDVTADPDYRSADAAVRSEIALPLLDQGEVLGVLNVESTAAAPLDATDLTLLTSVADRLAAALALARQRERLAARVALLDQLRELSGAIGSTLDPGHVYGALVRSAAGLFGADLVGLTVLDRASGRYLVRAVEGIDPAAVGAEIRPGEGMAGRAIRDRTLVIDENFGRAAYPSALVDVAVEVRVAAGVPIVRDGAVVGALTIGRSDPERRFTALEREAMTLLAGQAGLAIANAFLHAEVAELAIRDPLTGLHNRRYFDEMADRVLAARRRRTKAERRPVSAIIFDLDHFGRLNEAHGHQSGDAILRAFAGLLRDRFRESDLVARVGGEEFVAFLEDATLADAVRIAEWVRTTFRALRVRGVDGEPIEATVSAGCAELAEVEPTREALLRAADVALYVAKHAGRDRVEAAA